MVADDEEAYRYLVESIRRFPDQGKFTTMITDAGFKHANYQNLSGGIATIHSAWRIWGPSNTPGGVNGRDSTTKVLVVGMFETSVSDHGGKFALVWEAANTLY